MNYRPLGLYIHWPFCLSKCPYCDFNSFVGKAIDINSYTRAYMHELERFHGKTKDHTLKTIFFGGGTPSLMPPTLTAAIIEKAQNLWNHEDAMEITLEANPSTAEIGRFQDFKAAGINRLSVGIQSFDDAQLKFLGRGHSADEGIKAIDLAQKLFERVTFDLIYARPDQTFDEWRRELTFALTFGTSHLSLYQLTIEPGTAFAPRYDRGEIVLPEDDMAADLYALTHDLTKVAGLPMYEVSNHAKPGLESQHNLIYWRYQDYVGVGPGAHGRYINSNGEKIATEQHKAPEIWVNNVLEKGSGTVRQSIVTIEEQSREKLMMGLRLREGVMIDSSIPSARLEKLHAHGDIHLSDNHLKLTDQGFPRLNAVLRYMLEV
ncbi:MAG: radical SAM family heme chaperone HemW [Alphaproteobacteria bacterium]|nr:radical SAM family heme chaperone HemW [Alphaproteobacteria bacterium]